MGQQQSKDELVHQHVNNGDIEGIKALHREGASLEWFDKEGKTPLILACMKLELINVAKILIELGADVNAYRPGGQAGTPLHQAAKNGLHETVRLLLSNGANALLRNSRGRTPLDVARYKGFSFVVRAIESHICFFSGWLRELHGPSFLEVLLPQLLSRKIWVVVTPHGFRKHKKPLRLELAIYSSQQDGKPSVIIALWKAKIQDPKFHQLDPSLVIIDKATKKRYKLGSANEGDKQQLQWLCNACKGVPKVKYAPMPPPHTHTPVVPAVAPPSVPEDVELSMAIRASIQSAMEERQSLHPDITYLSSGVSHTNGWGPMEGHAPTSKVSINGWLDEPTEDAYKGWGIPEAGSSSNPSPHEVPDVAPTLHEIPRTESIPSAPPILVGAGDGPVQYPTVDSNHVDLSVLKSENMETGTSEVKEDGGSSSSCVICLDASVEGACIPCGHMAGCMSCLNEIKSKKWGCPVCRAKIDQVVRLYAV